MRPLCNMRAAFLWLIIFAPNVHAVQGVPIVYEDEYVTVRAGIRETGLRPVHLGDAVSLSIQVEFDAVRARVEKLDTDFFQRAHANQKGFKLYAPPHVTQENRSDNLVAIRTTWTIQILDCPGDLDICPGDKIYDLPVISIVYQLIDDSGEALNNKSARFRPWPGRLAVSPAIAASSPLSDKAAGDFADYLPGGAYPAALQIVDRQNAGLLAAAVGGLLFAAGIGNGLVRTRSRRHVTHTRPAANRWESVLSRLRSDSMHDDQWADMLRRCATWYCLDELGRNPYAWLTNKATSTTNTQQLADFRLFFIYLLNQESIGPERRNEYLHRFTQLAEKTVGAGALEDIT